MSLNKDPWVYARSPLEPPPDDLHDVCLNDETHDSRSVLSPGSRPECLKNLLHECLFVALIALAAATPVFLQRSIVVVTSSIAESLRMSPAELAWSTASSGLTTGAFLLPFGHIADTCAVLPRKALLVTSLAAFALLSACTSFSQTGVVLDVLSGLTGVACAANIPIALGILSLVYPENSRRKNIVFSSFFMGTPAATIVGGLGSGGLALKISWKAPFIALGGLFAIISVLAWVFIPNVPEPEVTLQRSELRINTDRNAPQIVMLGATKRITAILQFDWPGLALLIIGVLLFTVSLTIGPEGPEPWKTPTVILLLTLGLLFLGCFIVWQNVSKRPMIPPSIWNNWSVTLIVICTLGASMAFYSQLFWVSMFMQQLANLNSFEVAVRLLPQALVGLLVSPLVGLFMHTIPEHHSIGASLLQTTSRLGVPLGLAVTTSIWSSFDGKADWSQPELAYTHTFIATTAFASLSLLLVPFIRIGKQGHIRRLNTDPEVEAANHVKRRSLLLSASSLRPTESDKSSTKDAEHRPSKRWSPVGSVVPSTTGRRSTRAPSISSQSSMGMDTSRSESIAKTAIRRGRCSSEKVVWIVCEECGTSKRQRESSSHTVVGDPTRYFNDVVHGPDSNASARDAAHYQQHRQTVRRSPPRLGSPTRRNTLQKPYPGRRRLPLVNRQIMTHQILTQGFQP
ncbi:hypothetical protein CIB48_g6384 [Xylaria polymorpha]|nr:hypothetical protein CIB48_g6384 [Xylaria polymorpha]